MAPVPEITACGFLRIASALRVVFPAAKLSTAASNVPVDALVSTLRGEDLIQRRVWIWLVLLHLFEVDEYDLGHFMEFWYEAGM
jgi:uncharacterized membrane protein